MVDGDDFSNKACRAEKNPDPKHLDPRSWVAGTLAVYSTHLLVQLDKKLDRQLQYASLRYLVGRI